MSAASAPPAAPPPPLSTFLTSPFPIRLLLVRHGQAATNLRPDLIAGRQDAAPLTAVGEVQARALAARLQSIPFVPHLLLSSTAERAAATARLLYPERTATLSAALVEQSQGRWEGRSRAFVHTSFVRAEMLRLNVDFAAPNGESIRQAAERALRDIMAHVQRWRDTAAGSSGDGVDALVVAHGMVIRALLFALCGLRGDCVWRVGCHNCSVSEVHIDVVGVSLMRLNDHSHIDGIPDKNANDG